MNKAGTVDYHRTWNFNLGVFIETGSYVAAILFERLFFLMRNNKSENNEYVDEYGRPWCFASVSGTYKFYEGCFSRSAINNALRSMVELDILVAKEGMRANSPRQYTITERMTDVMLVELEPGPPGSLEPVWHR